MEYFFCDRQKCVHNKDGRCTTKCSAMEVEDCEYEQLDD